MCAGGCGSSLRGDSGGGGRLAQEQEAGGDGLRSGLRELGFSLGHFLETSTGASGAVGHGHTPSVPATHGTDVWIDQNLHIFHFQLSSSIFETHSTHFICEEISI